jgi:hypothetical protein
MLIPIFVAHLACVLAAGVWVHRYHVTRDAR